MHDWAMDACESKNTDRFQIWGETARHVGNNVHLNLSNREVSISHRPKFVDLQYKEIEIKGEKQK